MQDACTPVPREFHSKEEKKILTFKTMALTPSVSVGNRTPTGPGKPLRFQTESSFWLVSGAAVK